MDGRSGVVTTGWFLRQNAHSLAWMNLVTLTLGHLSSVWFGHHDDCGDALTNPNNVKTDHPLGSSRVSGCCHGERAMCITAALFPFQLCRYPNHWFTVFRSTDNCWLSPMPWVELCQPCSKDKLVTFSSWAFSPWQVCCTLNHEEATRGYVTEQLGIRDL